MPAVTWAEISSIGPGSRPTSAGVPGRSVSPAPAAESLVKRHQHQLVRGAETGPSIERLGSLARAEHQARVPPLPGSADRRVEEFSADSATAVGRQDEDV